MDEEVKHGHLIPSHLDAELRGNSLGGGIQTFLWDMLEMSVTLQLNGHTALLQGIAKPLPAPA